MIVQVENALSARSCRRLMALYDRCAGQASGKDSTGHPVVYCPEDTQAMELTLLETLVHRAAGRAAALSPHDPIYAETVILAAIGAGGCHARHSDNSQQDTHGAWTPNHTPQRVVSTLYYLNDAFEGGELVFEAQEVVIRPHPGLFLAFPSDERFVHEVRPVSAGHRYSLAIWFTRRRELALPAFHAT